MIINTVVMLVIAFLLVLSADFGVGLFLDHEASRSFGAQYLRSIAFFFLFLGVNLVLSGIVRASGATVHVLVLNLISFSLLRYPLTYLIFYWWGAAVSG